MLLSRCGEEICEPFLERDWDELGIPMIMAFQNIVSLEVRSLYTLSFHIPCKDNFFSVNVFKDFGEGKN